MAIYLHFIFCMRDTIVCLVKVTREQLAIANRLKPHSFNL